MSAAVIELNSETFDAATKSGVVLIDFWATWCGPCKMMLPVLEQLAAEVGPAIKIAKVNVEDSKDLAGRFAVRNIPALFILKDGQVVNQFVGVQSKVKLLEALRNA